MAALLIGSLYRLTIVTLYRHLYVKYIGITYNITYKGFLYFDIPGAGATLFTSLQFKHAT